ncbi:MAG TPA: transposase [Roseateles sp.]
MTQRGIGLRRHSAAFKARVIELARQPGVSTAAVALAVLMLRALDVLGLGFGGHLRSARFSLRLLGKASWCGGADPL